MALGGKTWEQLNSLSTHILALLWDLPIIVGPTWCLKNSTPEHFTLSRSTTQYRDFSKTMFLLSRHICTKEDIAETTSYWSVSSSCTTFKSIILNFSATPYICKEQSVRRAFNQNFIRCFYPKSSPLEYLGSCTYLSSLNKKQPG